MLGLNRNKNRYVFVIITATAIKDIVTLDMIGGTVVYFIIKKAFMLEIIAFSASMVIPFVIKKMMKVHRLKKPYRIVDFILR